LQSAADQFAARSQELCDELAIPLAVQHVNAQHAPGDSPEDAARQARYAAFQQALQTHWGGSVSHLALAQHADDQAETILLALSRGAGLPGLSAMPERIERHGLVLHRPWLAVPGAVLREWLQSLGVAWVEDPSNTDTRFTRNKIRHQLLLLRQTKMGLGGIKKMRLAHGKPIVFTVSLKWLQVQVKLKLRSQHLKLLKQRFLADLQWLQCHIKT
jgi:tRNA(Ile)-lysidine synthetase-like protein